MSIDCTRTVNAGARILSLGLVFRRLSHPSLRASLRPLLSRKCFIGQLTSLVPGGSRSFA